MFKEDALMDVAITEIVILFLSLIIVFIYFMRNWKNDIKNSLISIFLFGFSTIGFFIFFFRFGLVFTEKPSTSISHAKNRKVFVSGFQTSVKTIRLRNDIFYLDNAWAEREMILDHTGFFRKRRPTGKYYLLVSQQHKGGIWGASNKFTYYVNGDPKTSQFIFQGQNFVIKLDSITDEIRVTLVRLKKDSVQFEIYAPGFSDPSSGANR